MKMYLRVIGCSCYSCLPRTTQAAAQTALKTAAPGTGNGSLQMDQRLLTITWPKTVHNINKQTKANINKQYNNTQKQHTKLV